MMTRSVLMLEIEGFSGKSSRYSSAPPSVVLLPSPPRRRDGSIEGRRRYGGKKIQHTISANEAKRITFRQFMFSTWCSHWPFDCDSSIRPTQRTSAAKNGRVQLNFSVELSRATTARRPATRNATGQSFRPIQICEQSPQSSNLIATFAQFDFSLTCFQRSLIKRDCRKLGKKREKADPSI